MTELESLIVLNAIPGLTNLRIRKLLDYCGSAQKVLALNPKDLIEQKVLPAEAVQKFSAFNPGDFLKKENDLLARHGVRVVTFLDEDYPAHLKEIPDAPVVLYVKGNISSENSLSIAMVGSRRASVYGMSMAEKFARELAELGVTIVSGLARGIDTASHKGALKAGGQTLAVLGCGLARVYPDENKALAEKVAQNGAVISEFPMEAGPLAYHFPQRNRIISGLSLGVVVVEASLRSGALITSRFALEQGREVFAVPGNVNHPNALGVNRMIKEGAKLITCVDDILEELKVPMEAFLQAHRKAPEAAHAPALAVAQEETVALLPEEREIYDRIPTEPVSLETLVASLKESGNAVWKILLSLQLKHLIRQRPGNYFEKC
jgi:DNA processing protein